MVHHRDALFGPIVKVVRPSARVVSDYCTSCDFETHAQGLFAPCGWPNLRCMLRRNFLPLPKNFMRKIRCNALLGLDHNLYLIYETPECGSHPFENPTNLSNLVAIACRSIMDDHGQHASCKRCPLSGCSSRRALHAFGSWNLSSSRMYAPSTPYCIFPTPGRSSSLR